MTPKQYENRIVQSCQLDTILATKEDTLQPNIYMIHVIRQYLLPLLNM